MTKEARMRALKAADPETFAWIEDIWDSIFLDDDETGSENPDEYQLMNKAKGEEERAVMAYER